MMIATISIHWFDALLKILAIVITVANFMLAKQKCKAFKAENCDKKELIKPIAIYLGITIIGFVVLFGCHVIAYLTPMKSVFGFLDDVINGCLERLPLTTMFMWVMIPSTLMYLVWLTKGGMHYSRKKNEFEKAEKEKEQEELAKKPKAIDYDSLINFGEIDAPMKFRKFVKEANENLQYAKAKNDFFIAIGNASQSDELEAKLNDLLDENYPVVLHSRDGKDWEKMEQKDALKYVRKLLKEGE